LAEKAGIPAGVLNVVTSSEESTPAVGKVICDHPLIAKISFTGSTAVGKVVLVFYVGCRATIVSIIVTSIYIRPFSMCVGLLKTLEWERRLPPNFQGNSRVPWGWFKAQKVGLGVLSKGPENLHFFPLHRPARHGKLGIL